MKRVLVVTTACILVMAIVSMSIPMVGFADEVSGKQTAASEQTIPVETTNVGYMEYLAQHADADYPNISVPISGGTYISLHEAELERLEQYEGVSNVAKWTNQTGSVTWEVEVEQAGLYCLEMLYHTLKGKNGNIELSLQINGKFPFTGCEKFAFHRCWKDDMGAESPFEKDSVGNEIAPSQIEEFRWMQQSFSDVEGYFTEPYSFYFEKGKSKITLSCLREPFIIGSLYLYQPETAENYREKKPNFVSGAPTGYIHKIQAERASYKSDPSLRAGYDMSSPFNEPSDTALIRRNIIGGPKWANQTQWIEWEYTVPATGYYKIALRYRQNAVRGFFTSRRIYIDNSLTYREMGSVRFNYGNKWQVQTLGDENGPFLFYLEAGKNHTIRMEVTTGDMGEILQILNENQKTLSSLYRKIVMITGTAPDIYRDYQLEKEIPGLLDTFLTVSETLEQKAKEIEKTTGFTGTEAALLYRVAEQLQSFVKSPYTIPERLGNLRENISGLASWIMTIKGQPLELDYIAIMAPDVLEPPAESGMLKRIWYGVLAFCNSFFIDYNSVGSNEPTDECLEVWLGTGVDQMYILKQLVDKAFCKDNDIPVRLKLVSPTLLVQAIMAGVGPDVALNVPRTEPVNLALRGALEPLRNYEGFDDVSSRFMPTAMDPYKFYGDYYALPETQTFNMMFYRTDIFGDLCLKPPKVWNDLYEIAPILQRNNMEVGLPAGVFNMLLLQNGGSYYDDTLTKMAFDTDVAYDSFSEWVEFYTKYGFSLFKDDYNRFRTGEMPLTIMSYAFYCQLAIAAPEIRNLWAMEPIPGVRQKDGTVIRTDSATGTACIILKSSNKKEQAWKFINWWTGPEAQTEFGMEVESAMGTAARYTPASIEAFTNLPWTTNELDMLMTQWASIKEIPEVPGGYYIARNLDNAFRACVYRLENPREMLSYWTRETNKEIERKLAAYGLGAQL